MKRYFGFVVVVLGFWVLVGISKGYAQDCTCSMNPECTGDVVAWLVAHPTISNAIGWEDSTGAVPYAQWSAAMKTDLLNYFQIAWTRGSFDSKLIENPPPNLISLVEGKLDGSRPSYTAIDKKYAWPLYLSYVANSLAVEMQHMVPWSLMGYSNENLAILFDSRTMFSWKNDLGDYGAPGYSGYYIGSSIANGSVPASPDYTFKFLHDNAMITSDRLGAISKLVNWCRQNMTHYSSYCSWSAQFGYLGYPPVSHVIEGVPHCSVPGGGTMHYTAGCPGTTSFLRSVLRAINIPTSGESRCHVLPSFPTEGLYLSHGDDPYGLKGVGLADIPIEELFIDQATFDAWFGAAVSSEWCNNVGRRVSDLVIQYLPSMLLNQYCSDIAARNTHETGQVYNYQLVSNYTVAYLEDMYDLWGRLDACSTGVCPHTATGMPDLIISSVSGPATGVVGSNITFSFTTYNQGTIDKHSSFDSVVYLSTDATITSRDTPIYTLTFPADYLKAGAYFQVNNASAPIPAGLAPGIYYIGAIADSKNQVVECNERNAKAGNTITVSNGDTIPPTGTININNGATYTNNATVTLTLSATDASGVSQMRFGNDNTTCTTPEAYATSKTWTLSAGDGTKTVYVKYKDTAGNWSTATISDTIILDTVGPVSSITAPDYSTDTSANATFTVQWSATDAGSGVSTYDVDYRLWSSSTYTSWVANSATTSKAFTLGTAGNTYYFRVRARDRAGNVGSFSADKSVVVPFDQSAGTFSGTWSTVSDSNLYLGSARYATASTSSMTYNFSNAREVWLIITRRNNGGFAYIYIGGTLIRSINLYSASTMYRQKALVAVYATPTSGTLKVVVTGTKQSGSSGTRVEIDGIGIKK